MNTYMLTFQQTVGTKNYTKILLPKEILNKNISRKSHADNQMTIKQSRNFLKNVQTKYMLEQYYDEKAKEFSD